MAIFKFNIKNIKCFDGNDHIFSLELHPTKINYVVAPNGWGKTSFASAFRFLNARLEVPVEFKHKKQKRNNPSSVSLKIDNEPEYTADGRSNRISPRITPVVINSRVYATDVTQQVNNRTFTDPVEKVLDVVAYNGVPDSNVLPYNYDAMCRLMPRKGRIMPNIRSELSRPEFRKALGKAFAEIQHLNTHSNVNNRVSDTINVLEALQGQYRTLHRNVNDNNFSKIKNLLHYIRFKDSFRDWYTSFLGNAPQELDYFLLFVQLNEIYNRNYNDIKDAARRVAYEGYKERIDAELASVKCPWKSASTIVDNDKLLIRFPLVNEISNGQRDIATFFTQLLLFRLNRESGKDYLLIIDEVFDYLDEANYLAAQYMLSQILKDDVENSTVYTILLSHRERNELGAYVMGKIMSRPQYLTGYKPVPDGRLKHFIGYRLWLNKGDQAKQDLYKDLSNYYFHFNPDNRDLTADIVANPKANYAVPIVFQEKRSFYQYLIEEVNKYLSNQDFDPYAVCIATRLCIEKTMYNELEVADRPQFLAENETLEKNKYCIEHNVTLPDSQVMIVSLVNEAGHLYANGEDYYDKDMVFAVVHPVIKKVISDLFGYTEGVNVSIDKIYQV